jgi:hypothetical protein
MKRLAVVLSLFSVLLLTTGAIAAVDKNAISSNVNAIVAEIEKGKSPTDISADAYQPYAFIMEENGMMVVHPSLAGQSLKEKALPVYEALLQATPKGVWVEYEWKGKTKHTFAKKTKDNLIVGSGY